MVMHTPAVTGLKPWALYNEIEPEAAEWMRVLINMGMIAPGEVNESSVADLTPADVRSFTQFHTFAGIGVWSYALRLAGVSDDTPIWTGSCPCQPFSNAGEGDALDDDRHLWPAWYGLIDACRPFLVFGEQVGSAAAIGKVRKRSDTRLQGPDGWTWIDHVQNDLEGSRYAVGSLITSAGGVGAPHIRQRTYFAASQLGDASGAGLEGYARIVNGRGQSRRVATGEVGSRVAPSAPPGLVADGYGNQSGQRGVAGSESGARSEVGTGPELCGTTGLVADGYGVIGRQRGSVRTGGNQRSDATGRSGLVGQGGTGLVADGAVSGRDSGAGSCGGESTGQRGDEPAYDCLGNPLADHGSGGREVALQHGGSSGPQSGIGETGLSGSGGFHAGGDATQGFWRDCDWLWCRDERWRPIKSGLEPLVDGTSAGMGRRGPDGTPDPDHTQKARKMRLKGYGNAIVAQQAAEFITATLIALED